MYVHSQLRDLLLSQRVMSKGHFREQQGKKEKGWE